jgi:hypothetical protein
MSPRNSKRVFGAHGNAELRFELRSNGVERPEASHEQDSQAAAVRLMWRL